jgi:hypothetical protein
LRLRKKSALKKPPQICIRIHENAPCELRFFGGIFTRFDGIDSARMAGVFILIFVQSHEVPGYSDEAVSVSMARAIRCP